MKTRVLPFLFILAACTGGRTEMAERQVDSLNECARSWQYRDIDSLRAKATTALHRAREIHYTDGEAAALNCLMAERFQQMDFDSALVLADQVSALTQNQVELLIADVMRMRIAQRTSDNSAFFKHRSSALRRVRRIAEEEQQLTPQMARRFNYARSDLHIVASTYFYYVDQQERALDEIRQAEPFCTLPGDTAQWLYYCYMRGSGGLSDYASAEEVTRNEFDYLFKCFTLAKNHGYAFFQANAEQSLATLFADSVRRAIVHAYKPNAEDYLLSIFEPENTAFNMAIAALNRFTRYDDLYQEACALRTLGELSVEAGEYEQAIDHFAAALSCVNFHHLCYYASDQVLEPGSTNRLLALYEENPDSISVERRWMEAPDVKTIPEWIAGIRQQLSVAFSAFDMKAESDYNRSIYLDLLDVTREDAELESRYLELQEDSRRLRWALVSVAVLAVAIVLLTWFLRRAWRHRSEQQMRLLRQTLQRSVANAEHRQQQLDEEQEQLHEQQLATELRIQRDKQRNIEKRAKLQLVHGITPFLDRIIHETNKMQRTGQVSPDALSYIHELTDRITQYNELLTRWIQMEQGQLSLQLTSFPLQSLFDVIAKNHYAFDQQQLTLSVLPTTLSVKADRALTLFMLNTLADNARKFTPAGGTVTISAAEGESEDGPFVELSVQDTGVGLSAQDVDLILNNKVYHAASIGCLTSETHLSHQWDESVSPVRHVCLTNETSPNVQSLKPDSPVPAVDGFGQKGFGFGLMNCKGIIEKYRKTGNLFRVCKLGIESRVGEGSRFFFRLPRVLSMICLCLLSTVTLPFTSWATSQETTSPQAVHRLADSIAACNQAGRYTEALAFADSAFAAYSADFHPCNTSDSPQLTLRPSAEIPAEILWWQNHEAADYELLLTLRNEAAVTALALHDWPLYRHNNHIYTRLYKLANQDASLETYCQQIERSHSNTRAALVLIVLLVLLGLAATWFFYFRPQLRYRQTVAELRRRRYRQLMDEKEHRRQEKEQTVELAGDEVRRRQFEEARLHVQNQIIDNCLSSIKHETMYYPGRIHQLVQKMMSSSVDASSSESADSSALLSTLSETVAYYKEIFTLLAAQADAQSAAVAFRRHRIPVSTLLDIAAQRFTARVTRVSPDAILTLLPSAAVSDPSSTLVLGDPDQLSLLFESLFEAAGPHSLSLSVTLEDRFARFTLHNKAVTLSPEALHDFFTPPSASIPALIAKQIIREHDTFLSHPGCRINAEAAPEGHIVWFTLPIAPINSH
ncbi:MAG: DUF5112 domain-containing protein [Bacteroidaceae bacterium]|nr:DUF5112 domain-containing protein [Bacteroidaceae bacterium]